MYCISHSHTNRRRTLSGCEVLQSFERFSWQNPSLQKEIEEENKRKCYVGVSDVLCNKHLQFSYLYNRVIDISWREDTLLVIF